MLRSIFTSGLGTIGCACDTSPKDDGVNIDRSMRELYSSSFKGVVVRVAIAVPSIMSPDLDLLIDIEGLKDGISEKLLDRKCPDIEKRALAMNE